MKSLSQPLKMRMNKAHSAASPDALPNLILEPHLLNFILTRFPFLIISKISLMSLFILGIMTKFVKLCGQNHIIF